MAANNKNKETATSVFRRVGKIASNLGKGAFARAEALAEAFAGPEAVEDDSASLDVEAQTTWQQNTPSSMHDGLRAAGFAKGDPLGNQEEILLKARTQGVIPGSEDLVKAPAGDTEGIFWDPYALVEQLGYKEKPTAITYATLDAMFWKLPILGAIRQRRLNQMADFTLPQRRPQDPGFEVVLRDPKETVTPAALRMMNELTQRIMTTGYVVADRRERCGFEAFTRAVMRDSMTYDQAAIQFVPDRRGLPSQWYAMDAATIRLADKSSLGPDHDMDSTYAVQIYDNVVISEFSRRELLFGVRNPWSSIRSHGYGTSEAELCISTITHLLWGLNHNANYFKQGLGAKGVLNISGALPERQLRAFRRQWYQMVMGNENAFRVPLTNAEKLDWIKLQDSNKDMEYGEWLNFLIKLVCACFSMDPIEVNFKFGGSGQKSMFEAANKMKIVESKQQGLQPLLRAYARWLNEYIIWPINPSFQLRFVGLSPMTPKEEMDLRTQELRGYVTVDEMRAREGKLPLPNGDGEVILDPNWMQARRDRMLMDMGAFGGGEAEGGSEAAPSESAEPEPETAEETKKAIAIEYFLEEGASLSKSIVEVEA